MVYFDETVLFSDINGRSDNQDCAFYIQCDNAASDDDTRVPQKLAAYVVLDGVATSNGKEAVHRAKRALRPVLYEAMAALSLFPEQKDTIIYEFLTKALLAADKAIYQFHNDCCSTCSVVVVIDSLCYAINVGDSPAFLFRMPNRFAEDIDCIPLCEIQNEAAMAFVRGEISEEDSLADPRSNQLSGCVLGQRLLESDFHFSRAALDGFNVLILGSDGGLPITTSALSKLVLENVLGGAQAIASAIRKHIADFPYKDNATAIVSVLSQD